ncbi:hypothetical protein [Mesoplasma melaleucae]|uniref:Uncharacterized protein n=1 Tax=Mesoplasma melaleucae TaxID=81459 RepID=A0A2K8NW12_9MOLU|nr:hypothetical protein [Mesoplasma melaleucae]ATZ17934.1 hypothetical protein EMELA_v1c03720 [Mesoplasma melaleucae]
MAIKTYDATIMECDSGHITLCSEYGLGNGGDYQQEYSSTPDECRYCGEIICKQCYDDEQYCNEECEYEDNKND